MKQLYNATKFQSLLRKSGLKATPSRLWVLSVLEKRKSPLSAQDVVHAIGNRMDQATVYRIFKDLKAKGLIRPIDLRHNHAHYEMADVSDHHHLICIRCGKIEDVKKCDIEEMQAAVLRRSKHFAGIKQHSLEFYGICKSCE